MADDGPDHGSARSRMVQHLESRGIRSRPVLETMARLERQRFMPPEVQHLAYDDRAVPIGCEQTISQPYIVALMTEALQLSGRERVLEIGTGSGYQTALLAELSGEVISLERHADLSRSAERALRECGYQNVTLHVSDGTLGWPDRAPYDRILVAAAASQVPPALAAQLAEGGILVIPIGSRQEQVLQAFHKVGSRLLAQPLSGCRFVPLIGAQEDFA